MALSPGTRLGAYEVLSALGAGGMGEVYRARDPKLNRDIAIKILPDAFLTDPERAGRFQREAQLLAALNHPRIAAIYGLEESGPTRFLVMELVEGESLADHLRGGALPVGEALAIARQIGEALEAAHDKGIIHRDLKPANIMLTPDRHVKVLDFGLAKMIEKDPASSSMSMSPTLSMHATYAGTILGTAAYMSPEQARGKVVDKRTDVWAFGCVLFEMLTGKRAFEGEDATDTIAAVVRGEPDWTAMPASVPANIVAITRRCLAKERTQRFSDIAIPLFLIDEPVAAAAPAAAVPAARSLAGRAWPLAAAAASAAIVTAAIVWNLRPAPRASSFVTRFPISLGEGQQFTNTGRHVIAISPDGTHVAYVADFRLYLRAMSDVSAAAIPGTERIGDARGLTSPVFSPDGQSIAYFSEGAIKRIAITGGAPVTICQAINPYGITWREDDIFVGQGAEGIMRVSANGGKPEVIVRVKAGEFAHGPQVLPGGDALLFTVATGGLRDIDVWNRSQIVVQSLKSGARTTIVSPGSDAHYLPTGHLIYAVGGVVFAVRFDIKRLTVVGGQVPVVEGVNRAAGGATGSANLAVSGTGSLVYVPGPTSTLAARETLALLSRDGHVEPLGLAPDTYEGPRVSPDGKRIAVATDDGKEAYVWIYDLSGATARRRLTFGGRNRIPVWSADGASVTFQSDREQDLAMFTQSADGVGAAARLTTPEKGTIHVPQSWAPDGKYLLFTVSAGQGWSLWTYSAQDKHIAPFGGVKTVGANQAISAEFSPDGRWVVYNAGGTGTFVQPFPATGALYQIPSGLHPFWSPNGKELFAMPRGRFSAVPVAAGSTSFTFGNPVEMPRPRSTLFDGGPGVERSIDVMPDGKRFVVMLDSAQVSDTPSAPYIQVVLNWFDDLKTRVPVK